MEIITKEIVRVREDREMVYKFMTYDFIFETLPDGSHLDAFAKIRRHLFNCFTKPIPRSPKSPSDSNGLLVKIAPYDNEEDAALLLRLAGESFYHGAKQDQHYVLERYFIENDPYTLAVEVPVFDEEWLGSIDIIRYFPETGVIQILDFKPNAKAEKNVSGQLYRYAKLLAKHLGISVCAIQLIYFDDKDVFEVIL